MAKNWCSEHETEWFKSHKMKSYAHPIKDETGITSGWCERPKDYVEPKGGSEPSEPAPQELGMWWKELGNRIGDDSLDRDYPNASTSIKAQYYKKMSEVTGVDFKKGE